MALARLGGLQRIHHLATESLGFEQTSFDYGKRPVILVDEEDTVFDGAPQLFDRAIGDQAGAGLRGTYYFLKRIVELSAGVMVHPPQADVTMSSSRAAIL